jgi:hypothetical protein
VDVFAAFLYTSEAIVAGHCPPGVPIVCQLAQTSRQARSVIGHVQKDLTVLAAHMPKQRADLYMLLAVRQRPPDQLSTAFPRRWHADNLSGKRSAPVCAPAGTFAPASEPYSPPEGLARPPLLRCSLSSSRKCAHVGRSLARRAGKQQQERKSQPALLTRTKGRPGTTSSLQTK